MSNRIVFLCAGNTCRSPVAEVVALHKFAGLGLAFSSMGLDAREGMPAAPHSVAYAASRGWALDDHRSRRVIADRLREAAWVIAMTRSQAAIFRSRHGEVYRGATGILGAPGVDLNQHTYSPEAEEVDDPYGADLESYFACGDQIARLLSQWRPALLEVASQMGSGPNQENG